MQIMTMTRFKKSLSLIVCTVLIAAIALFASGCNGNTNVDTPPSAGSSLNSQAGVTVLGEGATAFQFTVTNADGKETAYEIHTDKTTVGEALLDLSLIAGDDGAYGLYVKTVDGVTLDYDTDGMYWAFYENGVYASQGVDSTEITEGASYSFKAES